MGKYMGYRPTLILAGAAAWLLLAQVAVCEPVTFDLAGQVNDVDLRQGRAPLPVSVGDPFRLSFSVDPEGAEDLCPDDPLAGCYDLPIIQLAGRFSDDIPIDPLPSVWLQSVVVEAGDGVSLFSANVHDTASSQNDDAMLEIRFGVEDPLGLFLSGESFPTQPPAVPLTGKFDAVVASGTADDVLIVGGAVTLVPGPECALVLVVLFAHLALRRRRRSGPWSV